MPYPDYGALLPIEALFETPKAYSGMLKAEAQKRASYLSQMDQFYEQLEESKRRFEKSYELRERQLAAEEEQLEWKRGFAEEQFGWEKEQAEWERGFTEEQTELEREYKTSALEQEKELALLQHSLGRRQLRESARARQETFEAEEEQFGMITDYLDKLYPRGTTQRTSPYLATSVGGLGTTGYEDSYYEDPNIAIMERVSSFADEDILGGISPVIGDETLGYKDSAPFYTKTPESVKPFEPSEDFPERFLY